MAGAMQHTFHARRSFEVVWCLSALRLAGLGRSRQIVVLFFICCAARPGWQAVGGAACRAAEQGSGAVSMWSCSVSMNWG